MTKSDYWEKLVDKNPIFGERETILITTSSLERIIKQAFEKGRIEGEEEDERSPECLDFLLGIFNIKDKK